MASWRDSKQKSPRDLSPGKRILIVCEGKKTEFGYFESIRQSMSLKRTQIRVVKPDGTDPFGIVSAAIALRAQEIHNLNWTSKTDSTWAVFDGDEHIANNRSNWEKALGLADKHHIKLAISNPSFEYWYLLHFRDHNGHLTRQTAYDLVKSYIRGYEKAALVYRSHLVDLTTDAIDRAKRLHRQRERDGCERYSNPCAHVCYLVEELLALKKETSR